LPFKLALPLCHPVGELLPPRLSQRCLDWKT